MGAGYPELVVLLHLVIAHLLVDFVLQPKSWVEDKQRNGWRSKYLLAHAALAGAISYLFVMDWGAWYVPVIIGVSHFAIDALKTNHTDGARTFTLDQLAHFAVIVLVWLALIQPVADLGSVADQLRGIWESNNVALLITGLIFVIWPAGILIGKVTKGLRDKISALEGNDLLDLNGRYIGYAERIMIFLFVMVDQYIAIGFIVATKSIFRLDERRSPAYIEYHLLGSLLSFAAAIVVGLIVRYLMLV
jgi:hypothetical protein